MLFVTRRVRADATECSLHHAGGVFVPAQTAT